MTATFHGAAEASLEAWITLGLLLHVHPRLWDKLKPAEIDLEALISMDEERLESSLFLQPREVMDILRGDFRGWAAREMAACRRQGIGIIPWDDAGYPAGLRSLPDPPAYLYVRGALSPADEIAVALVGSRHASPYGVAASRTLAAELAARGVTVVSGLARGIDACAHEGALQAGGRTVAVLGCGVDVTYPKENGRLMDHVAGSGAVVSEFPLGAAPQPRHFPVRNRIIAGLSQAVVVVEAARRSGSLITAGLALTTLDRPVGAVPGPITSRTSEGCNDLIYDGAVPVRGVEDIIGMLPDSVARRLPAPAPVQKSLHLDGPVQAGSDAVLSGLSLDAPRSVEEMARSLDIAPGALQGHLLDLELAGLISQLPGGLYVRR
jgi:DNA processing protein